VDERARKGFAAAAGAYQASRPTWPIEAIRQAFEEWELDPAGGLVVDLAAGTGRLADQLRQVCPHVVAIEPVDEMRAHIRHVEALPGTAEDIPLKDAAVLAVFVGEAFHWFDYTPALAELSRVLRPEGGLAVMWNNPVPNAAEDDLRRAIAELLEPYAYHPKGRNLFAGDPREERAWLSASGWESFEPVQRHEFFHEQEMTRNELVELVASWSFVAGLKEPERGQALSAVDRLLEERGIEHHGQRWRCDMYLTRRR
jgi:ubiquinone/menaquinone biosynthesis C-methylase UbiE